MFIFVPDLRRKQQARARAAPKIRAPTQQINLAEHSGNL
jgi:hypothetical protein